MSKYDGYSGEPFPVFAVYPEDWIGSDIVIFNDRMACLAASLVGTERLQRGEKPIAQMRIASDTTPAFIQGWLRRMS